MNIRKAVKTSQALMLTSIIVILTAFYYSNQMTRNLFNIQHDLVEVLDDVNDVLHLKNALLFEQDFSVLHNTASQFGTLSTHIKSLKDNLQKIDIQDDDLTRLENEVARLKVDLERLIELQLEYGLTENEGLRHKFRTSVHAIQNIFNVEQQSELQILVLEIRRREKDYLIRGGSEYLDAHSALILELHRLIFSSDFEQTNQLYIVNLIEVYQKTFEDVVKNLETQGIHSENGLRQAMSKTEGGIAELRKAIGLNLSLQIRDYFILLFSVTIGSVIVLIALSSLWLLRVNRRIYFGIKTITRTMDHITTQNNFKIRFDVNSNDEFGHLSEDLNQLLSHFSKVLTNLEEAQERMIQSEKLASLVGMVSGVAHELNTPLGVSITSSSLIKSQIEEIKQSFNNKALSKNKLLQIIDKSEQSIEILENNLTRTNQLIMQFKEITAYQNYNESVEFCLYTIIETVVIGLKQEFGKIESTVEIDVPKHWLFKSYSGAYAQIMQLLLVNCLRHAYQAPSPLIISISANISDAGVLNLVLSDNGKGVAEGNILKIFEPFYTTNRNNGGTGLGLSVVYNLVEKKLHGKVSASLNQSGGLTVKIDIPNMYCI